MGPQVTQTLNAIREKGRNMASYDLARALQDCDEAAAFSIRYRNPMSLVKARELKSKLAGLLIEKHEVVTFDLTEALAEATRRAQSRLPHPPPVVDRGAGVEPGATVHSEPNAFRDREAFGD